VKGDIVRQVLQREVFEYQRNKRNPEKNKEVLEEFSKTNTFMIVL
jgi:hypothetical protein